MGNSKYKIFAPGDKGYNENRRYPWSGIYESLGMKQPHQPFTVDGYYLLDRRFTPSMAIFKNCVLPCAAGYKPPMDGPPEPYASPKDAWMARERMHLSADATEMVQIYGLVLDPGIGMAKPDMLIFSKKEFANS